MNITIESPHVRVSQETISTIDTKLSSLLRKYGSTVMCEVLLRKENNDDQKNCHIGIKLGVPGTSLFAEETEQSFEAAFDKLIEDLKRQLQKHKEKLEEVRG
ncbi:MAG TPA: ribosome-associated translation inhibitor RaiA [Parafilimonas sp.]|nr:ribosome-associated translation inhibitor RaiA [Parafilimonas sp.]